MKVMEMLLAFTCTVYWKLTGKADKPASEAARQQRSSFPPAPQKTQKPPSFRGSPPTFYRFQQFFMYPQPQLLQFPELSQFLSTRTQFLSTALCHGENWQVNCLEKIANMPIEQNCCPPFYSVKRHSGRKVESSRVELSRFQSGSLLVAPTIFNRKYCKTRSKESEIFHMPIVFGRETLGLRSDVKKPP